LRGVPNYTIINYTITTNYLEHYLCVQIVNLNNKVRERGLCTTLVGGKIRSEVYTCL